MSTNASAVREGMLTLLVRRVKNQQTQTLSVGHPMAVVNQLIDAHNQDAKNMVDLAGLVITLVEEVTDLRSRIEELESTVDEARAEGHI